MDEFDWRACWHPVAFCADIPPDAPVGFSLHDQPFVLFRDREGSIACLEDRCAHRMARLSAGRVVDGVLECGYHGWQYDATGTCVHIPQLVPDRDIPGRACVARRTVVERQGIVWVWSGDPTQARPDQLPLIDAMNQPDVLHVDYVSDLPYDQGYLIENVIDVAHIHIAHDGMRGGGHRERALPLAFDVLEESSHGLRAQFRSIVPGRDAAATPLASATVEFRAPGLVHYVSNYRDTSRIAGLALYSMPLGQGRCRLLYRKYSNFYARREAWKPRWLEHWTQNAILQQDMALITGQYADIERSGRELRDLWLPLRSSDALVLHYRQWLDRHVPPTGAYRGFSSHRPATDVVDAAAPSPYALHTRQCAACLRAHRAARRLRWTLIAASAVCVPLLATAASTSGRVALSGLYVTALAAALACRLFEKRFE